MLEKRGRPRKYDPNTKTTIRFYIHEDEKTEIQIYALKNKITLQSIYEEMTEEILTKIRKDDE